MKAPHPWGGYVSAGNLVGFQVLRHFQNRNADVVSFAVIDPFVRADVVAFALLRHNVAAYSVLTRTPGEPSGW